jgi:glycosyltransferase involved in cell wall biosynthesis
MGREISLVKDVASIIKLSRIIKEQKCDIVHAHSSKAGAVGRVAAWLRKTPCVYTPHGWSFNMRVSNKKKYFYSAVEKKLSRVTGAITCISQHERDSAAEIGISPGKLFKIDNGIDLDKYNAPENVDSLKERLELPRDKVIIGMAARLSEQKDPLLFLEIAESVKKRIKDSYFILVGDGELRGQCEEKIAESDELRGNAVITGWADKPEEYIKCFDIGLLTSKWEGFGLVLAEYMACGVPVVASNVDGVPHVVKDGYSGLLCGSGDAGSFADCVCQLASDKTLVSYLASNALREVRERFSAEKMAAGYELVYEKVVLQQ